MCYHYYISYTKLYTSISLLLFTFTDYVYTNIHTHIYLCRYRDKNKFIIYLANRLRRSLVTMGKCYTCGSQIWNQRFIVRNDFPKVPRTPLLTKVPTPSLLCSTRTLQKTRSFISFRVTSCLCTIFEYLWSNYPECDLFRSC